MTMVSPDIRAGMALLVTQLAAAAEAGFQAVEFLFPYEHPPEAVAEKLKAAGLTQALFNMPPSFVIVTIACVIWLVVWTGNRMVRVPVR